MAKIQARALSQFYDGGNMINPNDLVEGEAALIKALEKHGTLDSSKGAIAYCKEISAKVVAIKGDGIAILPPVETPPAEAAQAETPPAEAAPAETPPAE